MTEIIHNGHVIEVQDNVQELPIGRYTEFQRHLLAAANIGSTLEDIDLRLRRHNGYLGNQEWEKAIVEAQNLHLALRSTIQKLHPKLNAFALLVESIDGEKVVDYTEIGLKKTITKLDHTKLTWALAMKAVDEAKKKFRLNWSLLSRRSYKTNQTKV